MNIPPPPAMIVLAAQDSMAKVIQSCVFFACINCARSSSVKPGGRGSFPAGNIGANKGLEAIASVRQSGLTGSGTTAADTKFVLPPAATRASYCPFQFRKALRWSLRCNSMYNFHQFPRFFVFELAAEASAQCPNNAVEIDQPTRSLFSRLDHHLLGRRTA
jgi:hypothetical protein